MCGVAAGYAAVACAFVVFVGANGGIVVGDREAHRPALHAAQLPYACLFAVGAFLPLCLADSACVPASSCRRRDSPASARLLRTEHVAARAGWWRMCAVPGSAPRGTSSSTRPSPLPRCTTAPWPTPTSSPITATTRSTSGRISLGAPPRYESRWPLCTQGARTRLRLASVAAAARSWRQASLHARSPRCCRPGSSSSGTSRCRRCSSWCTCSRRTGGTALHRWRCLRRSTPRRCTCCASGPSGGLTALLPVLCGDPQAVSAACVRARARPNATVASWNTPAPSARSKTHVTQEDIFSAQSRGNLL